VGIAWWWIEDGLDRFGGSPGFLNPVAPWDTGKTNRVFDKTANRNGEEIADVQQQQEQGNRNGHNNIPHNPTLTRQSETFGSSRRF
jgi:hypothetical protein